MALEFLGRPYAELYGDDLASAQTEFSKMGEPIVGFRFNSQGAGKMLELTTSIMPDGAFKRRMAIIMDKRVLSAPNVNSPIGDAGVIEGRFTKAEVDFLVTILRSGRLPATLEKQPASQNRVGAGLGEITIRKGTTTAIWSVIAILAFMLVYYQFSGVVASIALLLNGLLIFGIMIFIRQPLSLPGLAGLVLTVGMSVDANVLIYERIREEIAKGSAARLSIRNGFDRALTTIVDANLTTLIAAAVLYWIGTEQVRGFAVTLIIGIVVSMFTAIFCSRIIFEVAEKLKMVSLKMFDGVGFLKRIFFGQRDIDFMSVKIQCTVASLILIVVGLVAAAFRGSSILNIDFTGGTTVTIQLEQPVAIDDLRRITREILVDGEGKPLESTLVRVETSPENTDKVYTLVTSLADENDLAERLTAGLAKEKLTNLVTYKAKVTSLNASGNSQWEGRKAKTRLVSMRASDEETPAADQPAADAQAPAQQPASEQPTTESAAATENAPGVTEPAAAASAGAQAEITGQPNENLAVAEPTQVMSKFRLELSGLEEKDAAGNSRNLARRNSAKIKEDLIAAAQAASVLLNSSLVILNPDPKPENWREDSSEAYSSWEIQLPLDESEGQRVMDQVASTIGSTPLWLSLSQIGGRVAGEMQQRALAAMLVSLLFIVGYIWFRFQRISYGLAAVVALVHDVLITIGALALCHWLAKPLGFLLIEDFKIGLTEIAAFLTIIGYSLNDTIVVFDRIREIRGRSPRLTPEMINQSINQTLSRTLLTSGTTLLTVFLLYAFGGDGIHAFSFALLVGIGIGTYSSIYIASPILLWLTNRELAAANR
jgi:SecD/SecF fusion protein